ncbi:MAG: hypothetical protein A2177_03020 [Spirochaetes bacterium RBG_13_68_11]|nr:MAG: hypothetical protein A2177_03020 [Spirochaetes bacterium RBG_13_68_11]
MSRIRITLLLALAASFAGPLAAGSAAPARIDLAVSIPAANRDDVLQEDSVLRGIADFALRAWPALFAIRPGEAGDAAARVTLTRAARAIMVATELRAGSRPTQSLRSTVPANSAGSIVPTAAADIAWLWAAASGFAGLAPGPAPGLAAVLETDSLAGLTGWRPDGLEPLAIDSSAEGLTILFPRSWLTLGPLFRIGKEAARDLLLQSDEIGPVHAGMARSARGSIILARADGAVQLVDPLLAIRQPIAAPPGARLLAVAAHEAAFLSGSEATFVPLDPGETQTRTVRIAAAWITAADVDAAGNLWAWDGQERRLRVTTREGREISSVRPLVRASDLPVPQALAVQADGSLLLGGSGELWRFEASGIPSWRISRLPGVPGGSLPASFALAVDRSTGTVWLLDGPSRRVLQFGGTGRTIGDGAAAEASRALSAFLQGLDEREVGDLERGGALALAADMPLEAVRFAVRLARGGAPDAADLAAAAEVMVLRDCARAAAGAVEDLAATLLAERALAACQQAVDLARSWRDRDPGDPQAGRLLEELTGRRRELRDAVTPKDDAPALTAAARLIRSGERRTIVAKIVLRAPAGADLAGLRVSFTLPGWTPVPALEEVGALAAGGERVLELALALGEAPEKLPAVLPGAAWMRWEHGTEGRSTAILLDVAVAD